MIPTSYKSSLTPDFITRTLHLKIAFLPKPQTPFSLVTTDSRKVIPGCLFVALKGDNLDGHEFIEDAITQGARGILCNRGQLLRTYKDICIFAVEDSLTAYRRIASAWRKEFSIPIVVVAGSVGKTTTKELLAAILQGKWPQVLKTQGSQNGFVGIPMTLLDLRSEHEAAVIEVGIDEIGTMQQHMAVICGTASIITAIGPEHLLGLRDIPTIAREEGIALTAIAHTGGIIAINLDDPWIRPHLNTQREGRKIPFSLKGAKSSLNMISGSLSKDGRQLSFQGLDLEPTTVSLPLLGLHNATNLLGAIAIAAGLGLTASEIQVGLEFFKGAEGRSEIRSIPGATQVICDYYNAQPASVEAGLELLSQISAESPKNQTWACLGDMLEMGDDEEQLHRALANKVLELKIDNLLLFGSAMTYLNDELEKRGSPFFHVHFNSQTELANTLTQSAKPGDTILIKGSRGMKMEEVWKILETYAKSNWSPALQGKNSIPHP